jgi:adhesin transport system membrane fusion protein
MEEELVIEARLSPTNRGYVAEGKSARIKISAYDFIRYGTLQGTVDNIAADTEVSNDGVAYYLVTVRTDRHHLGSAEHPYPISPGMEATVDIHAGTLTVLEYLIRPVLKLRHDAFREP